MKKAIFMTLGALLLKGALPASASPELTLYAPAKTSFAEMSVPVGVRAIGAGEAYTASGSDVYALNYNPAGLSRMSGFQLGLMHNEWSSELGLRQEFITYGQNIGSSAGLGVALSYFTLGKLDERDLSGKLGTSSGAFAFSGTAGYGWSLGEHLKLGLGAEFGMESLFSTSQSEFGGSVGLLYDFTRDISFGISSNHLGVGAGGFMPPSAVNFGLASWFLKHKLVTSLDAAVPFNADPTVRAGLEIDFGAIALRGGYRYAVGAKKGDVQSGPTAGAGFTLGVFDIDYAFVPYGELSTTHRVSATLALPADFFKVKVIGGEATTVTAKASYDEAVGLEKKGQLLDALLEYKNVVRIYPTKMKSTPQKFYLTAVQKVKDLDSELSKSKQSPEVLRKIKANLNEGKELLAARRYLEAIRNFNDVLEINSGNKEAIDGLKAARAALNSKKDAHKSDGKAAFREGRNSTAIEAWRSVQKIDPDDQDAAAFFRNNEALVRQTIKQVHRKGIDLYVAGKVEEAVNVWKKALILDPADSQNIRRDIDKAQKLINLRGQK